MLMQNRVKRWPFWEKLGIVIVGMAVMAALFMATELLRPSCGRLINIASAAECEVGSTSVFSAAISIEGGTANPLTIDEQELSSETASPGFVFDGQGVTSSGGQRLFDIQRAGTTKLFINHDGSIQFEDNALFTSSSGDIEIAPTTNLAISTGALGEATGTLGLIFEDGTELTAMPSNTAGIYADDVAGTVEIFVIDEAGNQTQISPHPASLTTQAPGSCTIPFFYDSTNIYSGTRTSIDWCLLIADLEATTGNTYITESTKPANQRRNWWDDQASKSGECIAIGRSAGPLNACAEKPPPQYLIDAGVPATRP